MYIGAGEHSGPRPDAEAAPPPTSRRHAPTVGSTVAGLRYGDSGLEPAAGSGVPPSIDVHDVDASPAGMSGSRST
jgi:hypothetical protein